MIMHTPAKNHNVYTQDMLKSMNAYAIDVHDCAAIYPEDKVSAERNNLDYLMFHHAKYEGEYRSPNSSMFDNYGDGNVYSISNGKDTAYIVTYDGEDIKGKNVPCADSNKLSSIRVDGAINFAKEEVAHSSQQFADSVCGHLLKQCKDMDKQYEVLDKQGEPHDRRRGSILENGVYEMDPFVIPLPMTVTQWQEQQYNKVKDYAEKVEAAFQQSIQKHEPERQQIAGFDESINNDKSIFQKFKDCIIDKYNTLKERKFERDVSKMAKLAGNDRGRQAESALGISGSTDISKDGPEARA